MKCNLENCEKHVIFRYTGSSTRPSCKENMRWLVLKEPISVNQNWVRSYYKKFQNVIIIKNVNRNLTKKTRYVKNKVK